MLPRLAIHYLNQHEPLFAQVPSSEKVYKSWVAIWRLDRTYETLGYPTSKRYLVKWYEVHIPLYDAMQQQNRKLDESQACNFMRIYVVDEEELLKVLSRWNFDLNDLVPHWKTDFPFE
jgi:hypothetical protein